jgi:hypothetical protein
MYSGADQPYKEDVVMMLIIPNEGTYALKIENIEGLKTFLNGYLALDQVVKEEVYEEKIKKMNIRFSNDCNKDSNSDKGFLKAILGSALSLYKATSAYNPSGFKKIELSDNPNSSELKETNCN